LKGFVLPNNFIDGGVTGVSILLSKLTLIPVPFLLVFVNAPFILLGYKQIGFKFAMRSIIAIIGLAAAIAFIEYPIITSDKLLVSVFGGVFLGAGIGLAVRGSTVLDGTEILAIYLSRKTRQRIGDITLLFNIVIFSVAAYFLSIETALYSILIYISASKTIDFIVEGIEEYTAVTIFSSKNEEIRIMITEQLGRGVSVLNGTTGYGKKENLKDIEVLYTVVTRLEIARLSSEIELIDSNAFVVMNSVNDTIGGMIKKRALH
jgi:uncharacterized membrane-anchored protein YitT (DUF2179 family)